MPGGHRPESRRLLAAIMWRAFVVNVVADAAETARGWVSGGRVSLRGMAEPTAVYEPAPLTAVVDG